jgi:hypothetical protein
MNAPFSVASGFKLKLDETKIRRIPTRLPPPHSNASARIKFLLVEGPLQNRDKVIHIKATRLATLSDAALELQSDDFPTKRQPMPL